MPANSLRRRRFRDPRIDTLRILSDTAAAVALVFDDTDERWLIVDTTATCSLHPKTRPSLPSG